MKAWTFALYLLARLTLTLISASAFIFLFRNELIKSYETLYEFLYESYESFEK